MKHFNYILYSQSKDRYYIGYTSNLESRLLKHNLGGTPSTRSGRPWTMVHFEQFETKTEALKQKKYIKRMKSKTYIEDLLYSTK